jgi:hypothetical protein
MYLTLCLLTICSWPEELAQLKGHQVEILWWTIINGNDRRTSWDLVPAIPLPL